MSEGGKCSEKSTSDLADDWENAGEDAIVASVAERHKQLEQEETKLAVEQEQLKIHQSKPSGAQIDKRPEIGDGPIRLLRRPRKGEQKSKTDAELEAEAQERANHQALEERQALYEQTRERIFGGEQSTSPESSEPGPVEELRAQILQISQPSTAPRDHLSDVPMKRADTRKAPPRPLMPQPPPPGNLPMMMPPPWLPPYGGPIPPYGTTIPPFGNPMMHPLPPQGYPPASIPMMMPPPPWLPPYGAPVPPYGTTIPPYGNPMMPPLPQGDFKKYEKK